VTNDHIHSSIDVQLNYLQEALNIERSRNRPLNILLIAKDVRAAADAVDHAFKEDKYLQVR